MKTDRWYIRAMIFLAIFLMTVPVPAFSQDSAGGAPAKPSGPAYRPEQIEQMLAPIALYPDSLLAQVLAASTYPLEIVQAARFAKQNEKLKGDELLKAAKDKDWDPSVKAMLQFPSVLAMMNEKLDWTENLGDAFLSQQRDVMDAVQRLRKRAYDAGNLKSNKEQVVKVQAAQAPTQTIIIEPAQPQVVYVPAPNPVVVYGAWPYPAYPPYPYYPPGYTAGVAALSFAAGVAVGASWGAWGCGWGHGDVTINANQYNNFTKNNYINGQKYQVNNLKNQNWQHNPEHRRGAQYKDPATSQRFGQGGRGGAGGTGARPSTSDRRGYGQGAGDRGARPQTADMRGAGQRGGAGGPGGQSGMAGRQQGPQGRDSAFGQRGGGGSERAASFRGESSRGSQFGGGGGGGFSRGGGGGGGGGGGFSRGGGGGGGGRGRR